MKRMTGGVLVLAMLATGAVELMAQQGFQGRRGQAADGRRGGAEAVMGMRDRLELTDDQINSLEALRRSNVQSQNDQFSATNELRSQLQAGQIDRSEFNDTMRAQREANRDLAGQQRSEIEAILTEEQIESIRETQGRARAFARGRASMRRGQLGVRGSRDGIRGGPGMGPRGGFGAGSDFGPAARGQRFQGPGGVMPQGGFRRPGG